MVLITPLMCWVSSCLYLHRSSALLLSSSTLLLSLHPSLSAFSSYPYISCAFFTQFCRWIRRSRLRRPIVSRSPGHETSPPLTGGKGLLEPPLRILQLMRISWLALIGAHGQIWEAAQDTSFILFFFVFVLCYVYVLCFYVFMF